MTDRGLPIVDGAPACPFVAFEDDRDGRALAPDHRHRCFAEPRPAPRALAHQEAYCLSSAFPVCPTFQDWARREAAAARPASAQDRAVAEEPPVSRPMPPLEREPRHTGTETPPPIPPRRNQQRDWAAPPPWSGDDGPTPAGGTPAVDDDPWAGASRGLAGSAADRLAGPDPAYPDDDLDAPAAVTPDDASRYARPAAVAGAAAGAAAAAAATPSVDARAADGGDDDEPDWSSDPYPAAAAAPPSRRDARAQARDARRSGGRSGSGSADQARQREAQEPSDLFGPAWERPRRYEAYPSLRTRVGLPGIGGLGRVAGAAFGLILAALLLFFVGPLILGIGSDKAGTGGAVATATPDVGPTTAPEPTAVPAPTPKIYVVAKGDTMSKIARKNGVTIEQLLAANPKIKNPNKIKIGDEITIPVPVKDDGTLDESASP